MSKSFGRTRALHDVSFEVNPGEIHVLAGGNGAGKSTLIKIMSGAIPDHQGEIRVDGRAVRLRSPDAAARAGIATIHQELSLIGPMSVVDNLFLGERRPLWSPWSSRSRLRAAERVLSELSLEVDPMQRVETLPLATRQMIEIARALARDARILVMDEPTSSLAEPDAERLFARIQRLRDEGRGIVFISHRMEEVMRLSDRITVLRDGVRVSTTLRGELDERALVAAMLGRELERRDVSTARKDAPVVLAAKEIGVADPLGGRPLLEKVSFDLGAGEVLGLAGLGGSGATELLQALFGLLPMSGELRLGEAPYRPRGPTAAIASGVVFLASDRRLSLLPELSVTANATLSSLSKLSRAGFVQRAKEAQVVRELSRRLSLAAPSLDAPASALSGGNQQKVALARCLLAAPRVLLLDDPTRGVDIAAKSDVHALIRELAGRGVAVLFASSELDELSSLCDRVLVLFRGRVTARIEKPGLDRARLLHAAMGREAA